MINEWGIYSWGLLREGRLDGPNFISVRGEEEYSSPWGTVAIQADGVVELIPNQKELPWTVYWSPASVVPRNSIERFQLKGTQTTGPSELEADGFEAYHVPVSLTLDPPGLLTDVLLSSRSAISLWFFKENQRYQRIVISHGSVRTNSQRGRTKLMVSS